MVGRKRFAGLCLLGAAVGLVFGYLMRSAPEASPSTVGSDPTVRVAAELPYEAPVLVEGTLSSAALLELLESNRRELGGFTQQEVIYLGVEDLRFSDYRVFTESVMARMSRGDQRERRYWREVMTIVVFRWPAVALEEALSFYLGNGVEWTNAVFQTAAKFDPYGSYEYAIGYSDESRRRQLLLRARHYAKLYGETELSAKIDAALASLSEPVSSTLVVESDPFEDLENLLSHWEGRTDRGQLIRWLRTAAAKDPQAAFDLALRIPVVEREAALHSVLTAWASVKPVEALDKLGEMSETSGALNLPLLKTVLLVAESADSEASLEWLNQNLDRGQMVSLFSSNSGLSAMPATFLDLARSLPRSLNLDRKIEQSLSRWSAQEAKPALRWAQANMPEEKLGVYHANLIRSEIQNTAFDAFGYLDAHRDTVYGKSLVHLALNMWPDKRLDDALLWVLGHNDAEIREAGITSLSGKWAARDYEGAKAAAVNLPAGRSKDALLKNLTEKSIRFEAPESVLEFAAQIGNEQARHSTLTAALYQVSKYDPELALEYAQNPAFFPEGESQVARQYFDGWQKVDPQGAFSYAATRYAGDNKPQMIANVGVAWLMGDFDGASVEVARITGTEERLAMAGRMVGAQKLVSEQPEFVLAYLESLPDTDGKLRLVERLAKVYDAANRR